MITTVVHIGDNVDHDVTGPALAGMRSCDSTPVTFHCPTGTRRQRR